MFSQKAIRTLEFDKIREMLAECAPTDGARRLALSLMPSTEYDTIVMRQKKTAGAKYLFSMKGFPRLSANESAVESARRAEKGACLSPTELLDIQSLLFSARMSLEYIHTDNLAPTDIDYLFERLVPNRNIEERIRRTIISEDMIADNASEELAEIRRKIKAENNKIKETLQNYMGGARLKYLQENIVTLRDGRYVIPVKSEYRGEVKGLLHDTSSSGSTLFIEPIAVVEANNQLRILQNREKAEIERILFELSALCADYSYQIEANYHAITEIAFCFACAALATTLRATEPIIVRKPQIKLSAARHPLIKGKVVPINISLGVDFDTMIITGPNTGGKTVTLKTLGLFAMMAQSGLQLPAEDGSTVGIFTDIQADIGDEQSIEQSLSTFSSHMVNIVSMLSGCEESSLILFDELGAGTDPVEGAALAIAIIEKVRERGALCAATTHYAELKAYALESAGVQNASCEFDIETLAPTYKLIVGAPGKSNAFAISQKLGLPEEIVARADALISSENKSFENVIEKLENSRLIMEKNKEEAIREREEFERYRKSELEKLERETAESRKEIERLRSKAKDLYDSARASSDYIFKELDKLKRERESADFARRVDEAKAEVRTRIRDGLDGYDRTAPRELRFEDDYVLPRPLVVGDLVYMSGIGQEGTVVELADKKGLYTVRSGILKAKVELSTLRLLDKKQEKKKEPEKKRNTATLKASAVLSFHPEIDVRGMYGDDAWFAVDKYLDDAVLSKVFEVRIIHGKGTGVLRKVIQEKLSSDTRVKSFRNGVWGEGEMGVTIVTLK